MQEENFESFVTANTNKVVTVTVKNPKEVISGQLINQNGKIIIKPKSHHNKTERILTHENVKNIALVVNKQEMQRRRQARFANQ
ncbi:MAG: hypothetical protein WC010_01365 [Candidatus Absconditabacterales bacterium]